MKTRSAFKSSHCIVLFGLGLCISLNCGAQQFNPQSIKLLSWKFKTANSNTHYSAPDFDDSDWKSIEVNKNWEAQGYENYNGTAWYRTRFFIPNALKKLAPSGLRLYLGKIDDRDSTFLNGVFIGANGSWDEERIYQIAINSPALKFGAENVLAIKVFDAGGDGGMYNGLPFIRPLNNADFVSLDFESADFKKTGNVYSKTIRLTSSKSARFSGIFSVKVADPANGKVIFQQKKPVAFTKDQPVSFNYQFIVPVNGPYKIIYSFTDGNGHIEVSQVLPYILTPATKTAPQINGAMVFGVRPGSPVSYHVAVTGIKPLKISAENMPEGLSWDEQGQLITGTLTTPGTYSIGLTAKNSKGKTSRTLKIIAGNTIGLTPPMGWNSWNCWGLSVNVQKVKSSAQALIDKGLINHGWTYINIDDGWEADSRTANGDIVPNSKFPNMHALADWVHHNGLKFGIYSSPGPKTCGQFLGSYKHERQDAQSYSKWGVDYLKYDWCSYGSIAGKDTSLYGFEKPYLMMDTALKAQPRDIYFSLCQYGMKDVWEWGAAVGGNSWRTTGDISDSWTSLKFIGFSRDKLSQYAKPGHWNDPDMLIVGQVGWGDNLHRTHLTADEQYTHISLWCLLSAPLLLGCDLSKLDDFTLNLLTNDEVLSVDQDPNGYEAQKVYDKNEVQIFAKPLEDGSIAVGIFNLSDNYKKVSIPLKELNVNGNYELRDLWRQIDIGHFNKPYTAGITAHGVVLLKLKKIKK